VAGRRSGPARQAGHKRAQVTYTLEDERALANSLELKQVLTAAGDDLADDMDDTTRKAVAATRAGRFGFSSDDITSGAWVQTAKRMPKAQRDRAYTSTGRLAGSWGSHVRKTADGWVLILGSGAGAGGEVEYAGVYLWGYDPSGPRANYSWGGNDVFEQVFQKQRVSYEPPYQ